MGLAMNETPTREVGSSALLAELVWIGRLAPIPEAFKFIHARPPPYYGWHYGNRESDDNKAQINRRAIDNCK